MKVALISNEGGGISAVSKGIGLGLSKKKIYSKIYTATTTPAPIYERLNEYLEIVYLPSLSLPPKNVWFQAQNIKTIIKDLDCSVIHGVSPSASFALTFLKKKLQRPYVVTIHDPSRTRQIEFLNQPIRSWTLHEFGYFVLEYPLNYYVTKRVLQQCDHATFCSFALQQEIKSFIRTDYSKTSIIFNGVDFEEIERIRVTDSQEKTEISIIYAGRLYSSKGVMFLLQAIERLKNINVNVQIFGKGPLESDIDNFISRLGLREKVKRIGYASREKLVSEIKKSDIVVFPSLSEAQSIFMLEAMACKKPVIAFNLPFAREVIVNMKTGILTTPRDIVNLTEAIKLLIEDEKLRRRIGESAYAYVKKNHNWEKLTDSYIKVYETTLAQYRR